MNRILPARSLLRYRRSPESPLARFRAVPIFCVVMTLAVGVAAQTPPKPAAGPAPKAAASGVDTVIELVKSGMSESDVIGALKDEGKTYKLVIADVAKLKKAGVSQAIIDTMKNPAGAVGTAGASPAADAPRGAKVAAGGGATPFPPDLPDVPSIRKRRLAVNSFDYSTVTTWVHYWFNTNYNIGDGIRAMLGVRLQPSPHLTMVEREKLQGLMAEQDLGASNRVKKGTNARIGQLSGADVMLYGDIVAFGRDDTTKRKGLGAALGRFSPVAGAVATMEKSEKAVVAITLRLVDAETGEQIDAAEAKGESARTSKDYGGILGIKGAAAAGGSNMTSSNFAQTIIGEATSNAVTNIVTILEQKLPQMPSKARQIEGRVATLTSTGAYLTVGSESGVLRGDRFEILKINGEIKDPVTKEVIDLDAVKVGELVVDTVRDKGASGAYGGVALSSAYITAVGKGYAARLISK
jgi:curli biogenesis system outer membrane secretion channel CsgG